MAAGCRSDLFYLSLRELSTDLLPNLGQGTTSLAGVGSAHEIGPTRKIFDFANRDSGLFGDSRTIKKRILIEEGIDYDRKRIFV